MAQTGQGTHNAPSHEASVKGGERSHEGGNKQDLTQKTGTHNAPSHEASVKGGEHSHSGSEKK